MVKDVHEILDWYDKFDGKSILLKTDKHQFEFELSNRQLPHLLGLHYASDGYLKGKRLYNFIKRYDTDTLLKWVREYNPHQLENVSNRIDYFRSFMEKIEEANLYEMTSKRTQIKSDYLLVELEGVGVLQLGIGQDRSDIDYLETFLVQHDDSYYRDSTIEEAVTGLYEIDDNDRLIPFSFNADRDRELKRQYVATQERITQFYKDSDGDGLSDTVELSLGLNPMSQDSDGDGKQDLAELVQGDNPRDPYDQEQKETLSPPIPFEKVITEAKNKVAQDSAPDKGNDYDLDLS